MFRRLTAKEWGMIALSTVFICLAVWMDLKTPEYLSDITTLLAKDGTKASDIMDPGSKMLLFSFGSFLMAVFVGFLASRDLGEEQCLDNFCWDCSLDGLDSSFCFGSYCLSSPAKGSRFDRCLECDDTGEFDWGASGSCLQCRSLSK